MYEVFLLDGVNSFGLLKGAIPSLEAFWIQYSCWEFTTFRFRNHKYKSNHFSITNVNYFCRLFWIIVYSNNSKCFFNSSLDSMFNLWILCRVRDQTRALCRLSKCSTTELHPHLPCFKFQKTTTAKWQSEHLYNINSILQAY